MNLVPLGTLRSYSSANGTELRIQRGVEVFPSVGDAVLIPSADQLRAIVAGETDPDKGIYIGTCPIAEQPTSACGPR